jgi:hypothetical protein
VETGADGSEISASGGDASLQVYPSPDHAGGSTATPATWYVDDVERVVDELTANGVAFEHYEGVLQSGFDYGTDEKGISPRAGGGKAAWFKDPDGNIFSIEGDRSRLGAPSPGGSHVTNGDDRGTEPPPSETEVPAEAPREPGTTDEPTTPEPEERPANAPAGRGRPAAR